MPPEPPTAKLVIHRAVPDIIQAAWTDDKGTTSKNAFKLTDYHDPDTGSASLLRLICDPLIKFLRRIS